MSPDLQAAIDKAKASWDEHAPLRADDVERRLGYRIETRQENVFIYAPDGQLVVAGRISIESARRVVDAHHRNGRLAA